MVTYSEILSLISTYDLKMDWYTKNYRWYIIKESDVNLNNEIWNIKRIACSFLGGLFPENCVV